MCESNLGSIRDFGGLKRNIGFKFDLTNMDF